LQLLPLNCWERKNKMQNQKTSDEVKPTFEDGKQIEEYVSELDNLKIESEPNLEATQTLETVVEAPIRNEKKLKRQPEPPKPAVPAPPSPASAAPIASPTQSFPIVPSPTQPAPIAPTNKEPEIENIEKPEPVPPRRLTIDEFIDQQGELLKQEYYRAGDNVKQEFVDNSYKNLTAVINGEVQLVPIQQTPLPEQQPRQEPIPINVDDQLRRIDAALKDPALKLNTKALLRKKYELLGIPFDEALFMVEASTQSLPVSQTQPPTSPPNFKKEKLQIKWTTKAIIALVALGMVAAIALLLIGALIH
jgi:hypothetical protein